jgi:hypothetical protein
MTRDSTRRSGSIGRLGSSTVETGTTAGKSLAPRKGVEWH